VERVRDVLSPGHVPEWRTTFRRGLFLLSRQIDRMGRGLAYVALGTLRLDELRAGMARSFGEFFVDEADITSGFMAWESEVVSQFVRPDDRVLVIGSGSGRDLLAFAELGCRVTGVEPAAASAAIANRVLAARGLTVPVVQEFFEDAPLHGPFDFISFSWFCYSYTPEMRRRVEALRKAARLLAPSGRIMVSCIVRAEVPSSRLMRLQRWVAGLCRSDWQLETGDTIVPIRWSADVFRYEHVFTPGEFDREAASAELGIVYRNRDDWVFLLSAGH